MKENILSIKEKERAELAAQVEAFLESGGKIKQAEKAAFENSQERIGYNNKKIVREGKSNG
jgi:hypothetical protein